jgi:hypothetical protein
MVSVSAVSENDLHLLGVVVIVRYAVSAAVVDGNTASSCTNPGRPLFQDRLLNGSDLDIEVSRKGAPAHDEEGKASAGPKEQSS